MDAGFFFGKDSYAVVTGSCHPRRAFASGRVKILEEKMFAL
jgi:hypothetical protein